jgi:hypothetical protein
VRCDRPQLRLRCGHGSLGQGAPKRFLGPGRAARIHRRARQARRGAPTTPDADFEEQLLLIPNETLILTDSGVLMIGNGRAECEIKAVYQQRLREFAVSDASTQNSRELRTHVADVVIPGRGRGSGTWHKGRGIRRSPARSLSCDEPGPRARSVSPRRCQPRYSGWRRRGPCRDQPRPIRVA